MLIPRVLTAVALLGAFVAALFLLDNGTWTLVALAVTLAAGWEWGALAGYSRPVRAAYCGALAVLAVGLQAATGIEPWVYAAACAFWALLVPGWLAAGRPLRHRIVAGVAGWIVLLPAWLAAARLQADPLQLLQLLAIVWLADSAAYFTGRAWGRHPLAPRISPGKTWEGVAGAAAAVAVYYVVLSGHDSARQWAAGWGGALLFAGMTAASIIGDLFESWMKRQAGVKDSGAILPGHGGILDRIDGLVAAIPLAALLVRLPA